jgi:hypothetical protein
MSNILYLDAEGGKPNTYLNMDSVYKIETISEDPLRVKIYSMGLTEVEEGERARVIIEELYACLLEKIKEQNSINNRIKGLRGSKGLITALSEEEQEEILSQLEQIEKGMSHVEK